MCAMLQLFDIRKSYTTAGFTQTALDDVSINFRDNEFVAILGPSGSGKTTMLNIVGGLDHYDSGDLVIDGISTKEYTDRDWDTYRNNRIGFVFQSYNLIPHQTVLSNVELALTLSGVTPDERKKRATEALEEVGLLDHINKKPSQLSGGQMQRVAIARALINDPEILLADEPTGALDSKTSVDVMALLTEIAKDRLVIMVTHNPELAEKYATRTVNLRDGQVTSDSDPFLPEPEDERESTKSIRKTAMSFLTAISLSFNNLMTKKGRTLMTAFAGSIGIIGIAAILALANGVNNYIKTVEEDTLSDYPIMLQDSGFDMTSMMVGMMGAGNSAEVERAEENGGESEENTAEVSEKKILSNMFSSLNSNDLGSFKDFLDSGESGIEPYVNDIAYSYDVTPLVYSSKTEEGVQQVNPDTSFSSLGLGSSTSANSMMSSSMSTDLFLEYEPDRLDVFYNVVEGRWPEAYNEVVLTLDASGNISDFTLYAMGLRDRSELDEMVKQLANNEETTGPEDLKTFTYQELMDVTFKLVPNSSRYQYDEEYAVYRDKSDDKNYMKELVDSSEELKIVGIIAPDPDSNGGSMFAGFAYTPELTAHLMEEAAKTEIVKKQIEDPAVNVFTGRTFAEEEEESGSSLNMDSLFSIDSNAIANAFTFDSSALNVDMTGAFNLSGASFDMPDIPEMDLTKILESVDVEVSEQDSNKLMASLIDGYLTYCKKQKYPLDEYPNHVGEYVNSHQAEIVAEIGKVVDISAVQGQVEGALTQYMSSVFQVYTTAMTKTIEKELVSSMEKVMTNLSSNMVGAMGIDQDAFARAFQMNMTEQELAELMMSYMYAEENSYKNNLRKLGYASFDNPSEIDIYPIDFESKEEAIKILDGYNERMEVEDEEKVITYTDIVGTLMSSVTDIINMVSYVLVAFVAISLVVSSIMIGVITYISVLERKKEIGILRAIGASKRDIRWVFNAETLIVGFVAGFLGIAVTVLLTIPINAFVYATFDVPNVALLPWQAALVLILISMFLTFISGLIPSSAAARKDPVEALRSE